MLLPLSLSQRLFPGPGRVLGFYIIAHSFYTMLVGSFEVAIVLRLTGSARTIVGLNLTSYVLIFLAFILGTALVRSGKIGRSLRISFVVQAVNGIWAVLNFGRLDQFWALGALFVFKGLSEGIHWSTRHSAVLASIPDDKRDAWGLKLQIVSIVMSVVIPVAAGAVISFVILDPPDGQVLLPAGYYPIFALGSILALAALAVSPDLRIPPQAISVRRVASLQADRSLGWFRMLLASQSMSGISVTLAVGILNFMVLKTEFNIGLFSSWISAGSAIFLLVVRHVVKRRGPDRALMAGLGLGGESASRLLYFFFYNLPGLLAKSVADTFVAPLRTIFGENIMRSRIERVARYHALTKAEVVLYQEAVLFVSRVSVCTVLLVVTGLVGDALVDLSRALLLVFMFWGVIDWFLYRSIHRGNKDMADGEG